MSKMSRRIVVDASIAASAGMGSHPSSQRCRQFLLDMLFICHKVVTSKEISVEWKNHASKFSVGWLAAMRSRGKIVVVTPDSGDLLEHIVLLNEWTAKDIAAIEKDMLLILAALEADQLIASGDSTARELFARAAKLTDGIASIVWVNPVKESDNCGDWLKSGARYAVDLTLGT